MTSNILNNHNTNNFIFSPSNENSLSSLHPYPLQEIQNQLETFDNESKKILPIKSDNNYLLDFKDSPFTQQSFFSPQSYLPVKEKIFPTYTRQYSDNSNLVLSAEYDENGIPSKITIRNPSTILEENDISSFQKRINLASQTIQKGQLFLPFSSVKNLIKKAISVRLPDDVEMFLFLLLAETFEYIYPNSILSYSDIADIISQQERLQFLLDIIPQKINITKALSMWNNQRENDTLLEVDDDEFETETHILLNSSLNDLKS